MADPGEKKHLDIEELDADTLEVEELGFASGGEPETNMNCPCTMPIWPDPYTGPAAVE